MMSDVRAARWLTISAEEMAVDERDRAIIETRMAKYDEVTTPRVGDWVDFDNGNGARQRISYVWDWGTLGAQTSPGGSFYLGDCGASFSGSLDPLVPLESLTLTDEVRPGRVWIFHHDRHVAHNGVDVEVPFRVYRCSQVDPRGM